MTDQRMPEYENWKKACAKADQSGDDIDLGNGVGFDKESRMFGKINSATGRVIGKLFLTETEARNVK